MDNDKGLDLSLGLPCGGSSSNSKDRSGNSADTRPDTDERTSKIVNDFKNFLNAGIPQSFQRIDPAKPQENFFTSLPQTASGGNASGSGQVLGDNKRKSVFHEMNNQKKQERESRSPDLPDKGKTSYISITTDEGSTADNEDVAESEAEGSSSRTVSHSHCEEGSRTPVHNVSSSRVPKEIHPKANVGASPFPVQQMNASNVPYSISIKDSPTVGQLSTSNYPRVSMMQSIPSDERPGFHSTSPGNLPMTFGYSSIRVPMIDKDSPWEMVARPQSIHSPYGSRPISTPVPTQVNNPSSFEPPRPDMRPLDQSKGQTKPLAGEGGSSSHAENNAKRQQANGSPSEYPSIRPGIAAEVKFGGAGTFPSLPWVSTTGAGPNGKTISGVTYKFNATQVKIVCACHGIHMTPDEFVRHASEEPPPNTPSLSSLSNGNPATSTKS